MTCKEKDRDTCNVEKMGCEGCFYNRASNEEAEKLIEDMTKVRPEKLNEEGLKLYNTIMRILDERDNLKKERDYYKARYLEFNERDIKRNGNY